MRTGPGSTISKCKRRLINFALIVLAIAPPIIQSYEYGPDPGYTGAPGDNATGCIAAGCHTGTPNSAGGSVQIVASGGTTYVPGQTQQIMVTVTDSTERKYGFQLTARVDSSPKTMEAGLLTPGNDGFTQVLCSDGSNSPATGCKGIPLQWIEHTLMAYSSRTQAPPKFTYTFNWTPPAANVGTVTLYAAGNAVTGALVVTGTHTYLTSLQLSPSAGGGGGSGPSITSVNSLTSFGGLSSFASGSWIEINGTGLASDSRQWAPSDFNGPNAPTSLDGSSVTINGMPGFVYSVSPTQLDVQAPADPAVGNAIPIVVTSPGGTASATGTKAATAPGLLAPASFNIGGKQYLMAQFSDGTFVGSNNLIPGVSFRPARPGDTISVYGVGFGDVTPASPPGVTVARENTLVNPITVMFGSTAASVMYQGLCPGCMGIYQFYIVVPNVASGDTPINVSQNGVPLSQTLFLTVLGY